MSLTIAISGGIREINEDTKLVVQSEVWFEEIQGRDLSPSTVQASRDRLDKQILPALGELKIRELSVGVVVRHINAVKARPRPPAAFSRAYAPCLPVRRPGHQPVP